MVEMAQVAYEAYSNALEVTMGHEAAAPWNDLSSLEKDAWRAAVEAVAPKGWSS